MEKATPPQTFFSKNWKGLALIIISVLAATLQEQKTQNAKLEQQNTQLDADLKYWQAKYIGIAEGRVPIADTARKMVSNPTVKQLLTSDTLYTVRLGTPVRDSSGMERKVLPKIRTPR